MQQQRGGHTKDICPALAGAHYALPLGLPPPSSLFLLLTLCVYLSLPNCEMKIFLPPTHKPGTQGVCSYGARGECAAVKLCQAEKPQAI